MLRRTRHLPVALSAFAIAAIAAPRADAICGREPDVAIVPFGDGVAPLDAHVWVTLPAEWRSADVALRTAPTKGAPSEDVALSLRREARSLGIATLEMAPASPLRPRTRYEIWQTDPRAATRSRVLGTFTTGTATDTTPPTWRGIASAKRNAAPASPGSRVFEVRVECAADGIDLRLPPPVDDLTPLDQIRYAVWIEDAKAKIDYTRAPLLFESASSVASLAKAAPPMIEINLGTVETRRNFEIPPKTRALKIGVRAIDLAGNASAPSEAIVKL